MSRSNDDASAFKTMYVALVVSKEPLSTDTATDHLNTMSQMIKDDMTHNDIGKLIKGKIRHDRLMTSSYLTPEDRSSINKEIQIAYVKSRNFILMCAIATLAMIILVITVFFFVDLHDILASQELQLWDYESFLSEIIDTATP